MVDDNFNIEWEVDDGYVGNRPQVLNVSAVDIEYLDKDEIEDYFNETIFEEFLQTINAEGKNLEDFKEWALEVIKAREEEDIVG